MRRFIQFILTIVSNILLFNHISAQAPNSAFKEGKKLIFFDEFNATGIDQDKWRNSFPWGRWTHGLHYYTDSGNIAFKNDNLIIKATQESFKGKIDYWDSIGNYMPYYKDFNFTSGMIYSQKEFDGGYFECRFKVTKCKGVNYGFWLYGSKSNEIDIFEIIGSKPEDAQMTLHWEKRDPILGTNQWPSHILLKNNTFADDYHIFAVEWTEKGINWYLDNILIKDDNYVKDSINRFIRNKYAPKVPMNLIFTLEVGTLDGLPDNTSIFPSLFYIDYIRIYNSIHTAAPQIIQQNKIKIMAGVPNLIPLNDLLVVEKNKIYPNGFKIKVQPGTNYQTDGTYITPKSDYSGNLNIPITISDGLDESEIYQLQTEVVPFNEIIDYNNYLDRQLITVNYSDKYLVINLHAIKGLIKKIEIINLMGQNLKIVNPLNKKEVLIEKQTLRPGLHIVRILTNYQYVTKKIIVN